MIGPVAFLAPWLLVGLAALPVLWWLLRAVPPAPGRAAFPGRAAAARPRPTPRRCRSARPGGCCSCACCALAAAILAFAGPVLNPRPEGSGAPLLVLLDGGWGDAPDWARRIDRAAAALDEAARDGRPAAVVAMTTPPPPARRLPWRAAADWTERLRRPRAAALGAGPRRLGRLDRRRRTRRFETLWLTDGIGARRRGRRSPARCSTTAR